MPDSGVRPSCAASPSDFGLARPPDELAPDLRFLPTTARSAMPSSEDLDPDPRPLFPLAARSAMPPTGSAGTSLGLEDLELFDFFQGLNTSHRLDNPGRIGPRRPSSFREASRRMQRLWNIARRAPPRRASTGALSERCVERVFRNRCRTSSSSSTTSRTGYWPVLIRNGVPPGIERWTARMTVELPSFAFALGLPFS